MEVEYLGRLSWETALEVIQLFDGVQRLLGSCPGGIPRLLGVRPVLAMLADLERKSEWFYGEQGISRITDVNSVGTVVLGEVVQNTNFVARPFTLDLLDRFARVLPADHPRVGGIDVGATRESVRDKLLLAFGEGTPRAPLATKIATKAVNLVSACEQMSCCCVETRHAGAASYLSGIFFALLPGLDWPGWRTRRSSSGKV